MSNGNDKWKVDGRIVYPILVLTAISLVLVVFTKNDQLNLLDRILQIEDNMTSALNQSIGNYMHIRDNLREVRDLGDNQSLRSQVLDNIRGNKTLGCIVRILADADEDIQLVMKKVGIPANSTEDKIHVTVNMTHVVYSELGENITYTIPEIRNCQ